MDWKAIYINDLSTKEKRQVRQKVLAFCDVSKRSFYDYLDGKQGRTIIITRISTIVSEIRNKAKP